MCQTSSSYIIKSPSIQDVPFVIVPIVAYSVNTHTRMLVEKLGARLACVSIQSSDMRVQRVSQANYPTCLFSVLSILIYNYIKSFVNALKYHDYNVLK